MFTMSIFGTHCKDARVQGKGSKGCRAQGKKAKGPRGKGPMAKGKGKETQGGAIEG